MYVSLSSFFLVGLLIGSFISALTYRIPRNLGFIKGRSFCDSCKRSLYWYDNIPLLSYFLYLGKSRCCGTKISIRYPLIELVSAIGTLCIWLVFNNFLFILLFYLTLCIFVIDLEHQIIPDELSWVVLFLGLISLIDKPLVFFPNLLAGFVLALTILIIHLLTLGRGMGLGDVKLTIALGVWLGLEKGFTWLFASFIVGGIVSVILLLLKKAKFKTKIAFGPFLIFAFWLILVTI